MFYRFARILIRFFLWVVNGNTHYDNKKVLPNTNYILVGPHRTWWDPILFALAASPMEFAFMAKKELFKNPIIRFILNHAHAFPVDRKHPGPSAVKVPVKILKEGKLSLIIFPSGTRYSSDLKGGAALIAKMAKVPLVPAVYQGPLTFKGLLKREKITIRFGEPIMVDPKLRLNEAGIKQVNDQMSAAFDQIDQEINPDFKYVPDPKKAEEERKKGLL